MYVCPARNSHGQCIKRRHVFEFMNLFRATTSHRSMIIIINDNVDEERQIVSSISFAMKCLVLSTMYTRSNIECLHICILSIGRMSKSRWLIRKVFARNIEINNQKCNNNKVFLGATVIFRV